MKHWEKSANGWVFISHASADYESVKIVRNHLEDNGFSALIFYLKSLEVKDREEITKTLLKWEISERNIFVICDSEAARESNWVKWETDFVKSLSDKIIKTVDMEMLMKNKCVELSKLDDLISQSTLYFMYSHEDNKKVSEVYDALNSYGFKIFKDNISLQPGDDIQSEIEIAIEETVNSGAVLVFLSENAKKSKWFWKEKSLALKASADIIPIMIDDVHISEFPALMNLQSLNMRGVVSKEAINKLLNALKENGGRI